MDSLTTNPNDARRIFKFDEFSFDAAKKVLWRGAETVQLAPKACEILGVLIENAPQILSREELMTQVWNDSFVEEANLTHHISALRKTLGEAKNGGKFIETIPRRGYRFVAQVRAEESVPSEIILSERTVTRVVEETEIETRDLPSAATADESGEPKRISRLPNAESNRIKNKWRRGVIGLTAALIIFAGIGYGFYRLFLADNRVVFRAGTVKRLTTTGRVALPSISPDGRYIVYLKRDGGTRSFWLRQTATDSDVQITPPTPADDVYGGVEFTPDGNYIYYSLKKKNEPYSFLYRAPALGGATPGKILENFNYSVTFAPDGKRFAFLRSFDEQKEYALMIADADGKNERRLAVRQRPHHFNGHPAWSPDGRTILCPAVSTEGGFHYELLAIGAADGSVTPIRSKQWQNVGDMVWLPDSRSVLLTAQDDVSPAAQIWQVSLPGGEAVQITSGTNIYGFIGLTADARFLVVTKIEQDAHLWLADAENPTQLQQLTLGSDNYDGLGGIAWTPQADKIVYQSKANGNDAVWMMTPEGKNGRRLTNDLGAGFAVSPDGKSIVFQNKENGSQGLWRLDTEDGSARRLTTGVDITPAFSPDGKWMVFARLNEQTNLWRAAAAGGEPQQLTKGFRTTSSPTVSPDGKLLAFAYRKTAQTLDAPNNGLAIMSFETGEIKKTFPVLFPFGSLYEQVVLQWTPDGKAVNYIVLRDGVSNIMRQNIEGGDALRVTDFKEGRVFNFAFSPDGKRLALSRGRVVSDVVLIENKGR